MEPIIICYGCHKRVTEREISAGLHDHIDTEEQVLPRAQASSAD